MPAPLVLHRVIATAQAFRLGRRGPVHRKALLVHDELLILGEYLWEELLVPARPERCAQLWQYVRLGCKVV